FGGLDRLLLGTNRVYESMDNAENWTPLSTPNTAGWNTSSTINSLAVAPSDVNTIYASAGGGTYVTVNHGTSWRQINIPGGSDHIQQIVVDPTNSQIVYAVRDRFGGSKVFRTINGGTTWTSITGNLADVPAYSIVLDANGPGTADDVLYVGTDTGVFTSSDLGTTWNQLGTGLPTTQVDSLQLNQQNILAAGTYGRGIWQISVGAATDNVVATQDGNEAHLIWAQNNPGGETGFLIQRSTDGGAFATVGTTGINQTTFIDTTVAAGHTYLYQVRMQFSGSSSAFAQSNLLAMQSTGDVDHTGGFFGASDLTLNGAKLLGNGRLQLPDGNLSESRTAFLSLGSGAIGNFYTEFNFQFTNPSADGMTFTIESNSPTQVGRSGGDFGYGGITNSLSIIFNLYSNVTQTGLFTGGATNGTKFAMTSLGNAFHVLDGNGNTDIFHVALSYNASTKVLSQTVLDTGNSNTFSTSYSNIDLAGILHDQAAYVGFTGGTGSLASTQQIVNWWWSPVGTHPPFQINGTTGADTIYVKADADHTNIDYWLNVPTTGTSTGKFPKTFSGIDIHGLGSADTVTIDQSAGDVMLGQGWLDSIGGSISLNIIGSTGNDTYLADPSGKKLTFATNGAAISAGKVFNLANIGSISFVGNGGSDVITTAGTAPFTLTLASTGTEDLTVTSGNVTAILPLNNDALTINNIGGTVLLRIG
ncbi:MAG TPA: hypothetical protein VH370_01990, partial [Humisphaera sp.]|nr:hypothetical protein [Humisphaera sp.]